eukprot:TRINITY_DN10960_c0_g2_i2.p1 TRINITY_DN10960_c0_g2~~TRINITY_DN10960_c0_g2_i2.p1  ORF type:complete len:202 (+),score=100.63 TRINITY_DN10960_c0_g2_i2:164-769(+)
MSIFGWGGAQPEGMDAERDLTPNSFEKQDLCVARIDSVQTFNTLSQQAKTNDQMLVFKYVRDGCPACSVISVAMENLCKKYRHYPYLKFYEVHEATTPPLIDDVPKVPHVDAFLGRQQVSAELDAAPPVEVRREAMAKIENLQQVEEMRGNKLGKDEVQRMMMKELIKPAQEQAEKGLMQVLMDFNKTKATNYFKSPDPPL